MSSPKLTLQRLMQYVFDRDAIEARDALHETMVEMILSSKDKAVTVNTIMHEIEGQLGIAIEPSLVADVVTKLVQQGSVKKAEKTDEYFLVFSRKKELLNVVRGRETYFESLEKKVVSTYRKVSVKSDSKQERAALDCFYHFCMKWFSSSSDLLLGILQCNDQDLERIKSYRAPEKLVSEVLNEIQDAEIREGVRKTFTEIFTEDSTARFLAVIARNYLYFQILNLDPSCKSLQREFFSQKIVLLDTNFMMSLVLASRITHGAAIKCIRLSQKLGIQFRFSKRTEQEFLDQFGQSQDRFKKLGSEKLDILAALDDDFIADYAVAAKNGKTKDWKSYCIKFKTLRNILSSLGIQEYSDLESDMAISASSSFRTITDIVIKCALQWNNLKTAVVAEHDAYHLLLIRKLREKDAHPSVLGPRIWFLTFDQSLLCVDKEINVLLGIPKELPSSIECWAWIDLVSPFLGGTVSQESPDEAFTNLMRTNFRALPSKIQTKKLISIASNVDLGDYSVEEVAAIVNDKFINQYLNDLGKAKWLKLKTAKKEAKQKIDTRVKEVVTEVKATVSQVRERRRSNVEYVARIGSLIVAGLMVFIAIHSYLVLRPIVETIVFLIFGVLFMAMSIGYRQIELLFRELQLRLKH
jgi:hypothetical protein